MEEEGKEGAIEENDVFVCIENVFCAGCLGLTVGFEGPRLAAPAPCLVDGLDDEDVLGAALQAVHCVVVLLDVGDNHPALQRVTQACAGGSGRRRTFSSKSRRF